MLDLLAVANLAISVGLGMPSWVSTVSNIDDTDDVAFDSMLPQPPHPQLDGADGVDGSSVTVLQQEGKMVIK